MTVAGPTWTKLPFAAQLYAALVMIAGVAAFVVFFPRPPASPALFVILLVFACVMSAWKVNLPIPVSNGSTLSVSYTANLMALLLLGTPPAVVIAVVGAFAQCTYRAKARYPLHRTLFSMAAAALTMVATGEVYHALGGQAAPFDIPTLARPLVGAIGTYFLINTSLVAAAIALSTRRSLVETWRGDFLWSASSFVVAGTAGAIGAVVVARGEHWKAVLLIAPIYLTYRTYEVFVGRLDDQRRHTEEMRQALAEMTRLEEARKHLLEREQAARASAEAANRLKDEFLAVVSHELRTPLNAILGWADLLRRGRLDERLRERAHQTIFDSSKRQAQLIDDLLDVARIAAGKIRLERATLDIKQVIVEALQVVQPAADAKGVRLTFEAADAIGPVLGDVARLQQVTWNLLSNAVKFTPEGGDVRVRLRQVDDAIELTVADTGQGIAADFLPSVFDPFRQADGSSTRQHLGLGLGLSIVRSLVELHDGSVTAHSDGEGMGATFIVRLPVAGRRSASSDDDRRGERASDAASLEGLSVLVVDDDMANREIVAVHLQAHHASVITAASAAEAFDILQRQHVDVLLADVGMPGEDGYSLVRRVRALASPEVATIPAAALTALAREEDRQQALAAGFQLHLAKPVDAEVLVAAVTTLHRLKFT
jgi:signal transduction histidine kinase/ActR/RegA family two-component response regulator